MGKVHSMTRFAFTAAGVAAGFIAGLAVLARADTAPDSESAYHALDRFGQAFSVVRADYVEAPDDKLLVESALSGMISNLDPHSSYFDPKTYADMQVRTEGQYGGVGIVISVEGGAVKVVSPIDDTPASRGRRQIGRHHPGRRRQGPAGLEPRSGAAPAPRQGRLESHADALCAAAPTNRST